MNSLILIRSWMCNYLQSINFQYILKEFMWKAMFDLSEFTYNSEVQGTITLNQLEWRETLWFHFNHIDLLKTKVIKSSTLCLNTAFLLFVFFVILNGLLDHHVSYQQNEKIIILSNLYRLIVSGQGASESLHRKS